MSRVLEGGRQLWAYLEPWWLLAVAVLGVTAVAAGVFVPTDLENVADRSGQRSFGLTALLMGAVLLAATAWVIRNRFAEHPVERAMAEYEAPVLWSAASWALLSAFGATNAALFVFCAALVAWIYVTQPRQAALAALLACIVMELGLARFMPSGYTGFVLRSLAIGAACLGLERFATAEAFRLRLSELRQAKEVKATETARARDFGLLTAQAPILDAFPSLGGPGSTGEQDSLKFLDESFNGLLEVARSSLNATSAVMLWRNPDGFTRSAHASSRDDMLDGPFNLGRGLPGSVLGDVSEVALEQVRENFEGLPYYARPGGVGSAFAIGIQKVDQVGDDGIVGVLCVDRTASGEWNESDRSILRILARKIALDVYSSQRLKAAENEKNTVRRFCAALGELNKSLGIEDTAQSTFEAVQEMANADLMVITLASDNAHRVVAARGERASFLKGRSFDGNECLVGKAIDVRQTLPLSGRYRGHGTVFGAGEGLENMQSLMVIPLVLPAETVSLKNNEGNSRPTDQINVVGALTVAARCADAFMPPARDMIQLIARQIAIKLDLADAHEQIREMAKTDAMTGLANERSFDHAFSNMLSRAERKRDALCLIMTDIDKFKDINDTYGHPFGDEVIKSLASTLQDAVRSVDLAARIGGEEFALLLEDTNLDGAYELAERIRKSIEDMVLHHPEKGPVKLTLSMGIAEYPNGGHDQATLMDNADKALYLAKNSGRNQVRMWTELPKEDVKRLANVTVHI